MLAQLFQSAAFYYVLLVIAVAATIGAVFRWELRRQRASLALPAPLVPALCLTLALLIFAPLLFWVNLSNRNELDQTYPESNVAYGVYRVMRGQPLYRDFAAPPFAIMPYPPLYYYLAAKTCPLDRLNPQPLPARAWGRYLSLLFCLGLTLLVFLFCGQPALLQELQLSRSGLRYPAGLPGALGGALLFAAIPVLLRWANTCRPDLLALLLSALAIFLLYRFERAGTLPALLCCWLAFFAKHSCFAAPLAIALWHLLHRRWLSAGSWLLSYLAGLALLLFLGQRLSNGWMLANILAVIQVPLRYDAIAFVFPRFLRDYIFVLALGGWAIWRFRQNIRTSLLGCYCAVSFAAALFAAFKLGSSVNYFLEPAFTLCVLAGLLGMNWTAQRITLRPASVCAVMLGIGLLMSAGNFIRIQRWRNLEQASPLLNNRKLLYVKRQLQQRSPGPLLTSFAHLAVQFPEQLVLLDPYLLNKAAYSGKWDERALLSMLREGRIGVIALDFALEGQTPQFQEFPFWSAQAVKVMREHYRLAWRQPGVFFYIKK